MTESKDEKKLDIIHCLLSVIGLVSFVFVAPVKMLAPYKAKVLYVQRPAKRNFDLFLNKNLAL